MHIQVTGKLFFFSLTPLAASFAFTGVPDAVELGTTSLITLFRNSTSDPTAFSVIVRLVSQQSGHTIGTFPSAQELSEIPLNFTPTETGRDFIFEVISNLQPLSPTEEPTTIFAGSNSFIVQAPSSSTTTESTDSSSTTTAVDTTSSPTTSDHLSSTQSVVDPSSTTTAVDTTSSPTTSDHLSPTQSVVSLASHKSNTPAIIGGAIGATVLIMICLVSLFISTRRRRLGAARMLPDDMTILDASISPFIEAGSDSKYILNGLERREQNPYTNASPDNKVIEDDIPPVLTVPSANPDIPLVPDDTWGEGLGFEIPEPDTAPRPGSPNKGPADEIDIVQPFENMRNRVIFHRHQDSGLVVSVRNVQDRELNGPEVVELPPEYSSLM